ncbi:PQQ-like beta-propeller repeat protein [Halogeometricum sp. S1BR25-6]|uniref:PQQ-like beta-propeller repeat protein n=1 Tax=Halogeometricum salsisoli TaxID=2950536 RepID=A0ABU2G8U0_9EURY|nr:PQQ-binding-like beta-propeller repeat protein [Halogeometricum sp. S1BR25-6]MDS0297228.1 PQQ-like beta-propeller repeat protein [Halogeometricum sp. S1BR25-6]
MRRERAGGDRCRDVSRRRALGGIAALGSLALAGCSSLPRLGGVDPEWRREFADASAASPLAVSAAHVLVGAQDKALYGLCLDDGETAFRYETGGPVEARPAASGDGGPFHVHSTDGDVYTVDAAGDLRWREEGLHERGTIASNGSLLARLDRHTGDVRGFDAESGARRFGRAVAGYRLTGLLDETFVFREAVSEDRTRLVALSTDDGRPLWRTDASEWYPGLAVDERLAVSVHESTVRAYDPRTGAVRWESTVDADSYRDPTLGPQVYLRNERSDSSDELIALDRRDGSVAWRHTAGYDIRQVTPANDAVFVGSRVDDPDGGILGRVDRFDSDGVRRWRTVTEAPDVEELHVSVDAVVVSGGRQAVVLDRASGGTRWSHEPESYSRLDISATDDRLYVSYLDDGAVARFGL